MRRRGPTPPAPTDRETDQPPLDIKRRVLRVPQWHDPLPVCTYLQCTYVPDTTTGVLGTRRAERSLTDRDLLIAIYKNPQSPHSSACLGSVWSLENTEGLAPPTRWSQTRWPSVAGVFSVFPCNTGLLTAAPPGSWLGPLELGYSTNTLYSYYM